MNYPQLFGHHFRWHQLLWAIDRPFSIFLIAVGLSLLVLAFHVVRMLPGEKRPHPTIDRVIVVLGTAVLCLLAVDCADSIDSRLEHRWTLLAKALPVAAVVAASILQIRFARSLPESASVSRFPATSRFSMGFRVPTAGALLVVWIGTTAWFGCRFYATAYPKPEMADTSESSGGLCPSTDYVALTDTGTELPLFYVEGEKAPLDAQSEQRRGSEKGYASTAILRQSRNVRSNCHGWVFCSGRFVIQGYELAQILQDNRYAIVNEPHAGDVIVYHDIKGEVLHSGVVRGVLDDGTVMVESKWGVDCRYLHSAADQPYSELFTYYRSPRRGHRVTIAKAVPPDLRLSPDDKRAIHAILSRVQPPAGSQKSAG